MQDLPKRLFFERMKTKHRFVPDRTKALDFNFDFNGIPTGGEKSIQIFCPFAILAFHRIPRKCIKY